MSKLFDDNNSFYTIRRYHNKKGELQVKGWLYGTMTVVWTTGI